MRSLGLLGAAAEAEALRLRREGRALARATAFQAAAALFALAALVLLHLAAWLALAEAQGAVRASLVLALADVAAMGVLLLIGRRRPDPVAEAAAMMRDRSLAEVRRAPVEAGLGALADGLVRMLARR